MDATQEGGPRTAKTLGDLGFCVKCPHLYVSATDLEKKKIVAKKNKSTDCWLESLAHITGHLSLSGSTLGLTEG